jgi:hypothetical protein
VRLVRAGRDLRVDFFRGIALFCIFLDHIPHDALARFTVRNLALNDATEIFILLAGYAASLVYGRKLDQAGPVSPAVRYWSNHARVRRQASAAASGLKAAGRSLQLNPWPASG